MTVATVDDLVGVMDAAKSEGRSVRLRLFDDSEVFLANVTEFKSYLWRGMTIRRWRSDVSVSEGYDGDAAGVAFLNLTGDQLHAEILDDVGRAYVLETHWSGNGQLQVGRFVGLFDWQDEGDDTSHPPRFPRGLAFVLLVTIVPIVTVTLLWLSGKRASSRRSEKTAA